MRIVTFRPPDGAARAGVLVGDAVVDLAAAAPLVLAEPDGLQWTMPSLLQGDQDEVNVETAGAIVAAVIEMLGDDMARITDDAPRGGNGQHDHGAEGNIAIGGVPMLLPLSQVRLLSPLPRPTSIRLFECFEEHARVAFELAGLSLPGEWYRFPAFAFGNAGAVYGCDDVLPMPQTTALDYELELGCVIGQMGRDIPAAAAASYIAGYVLVNDWRARDVQAEEDPLGLGATKGSDFALSLGPWLATPDELELYTEDDGKLLLTLTAHVNSIERSRGLALAMHYSFAEMIAYASRDATLFPGDLLCSGAVASGSLLAQTKGYGPWLARGDVVELAAPALGTLRNTIQ